MIISRLPLLPFLITGLAAQAAEFQTYQPASSVLGQTDFTTTAGASGLPNRFNTPEGVAYDPVTGKVFVADFSNSRVLRFSSTAALQNGANPEAVFGQPNFTGSQINQGNASPTAQTMHNPSGLCFDSQGRLWVADYNNNRVLGFYLASLLGNNPAADIELGQADFTTNNGGSTAKNRMAGPVGVSVDANDTLWVGDASNNRVIGFDNVTSKTSGADANHVLGQADFNTATAATSSTKMNFPAPVFADSTGRLWVGDVSNRRVLRFDNVGAKGDGDPADAVIGQDDFTSSVSALTASRFQSPYGLYFDASGNLWVGDYGGGRALRFSNAASIATGGTADLVLGKPNFTTNIDSPTANEIGGTFQIAGGPDGSLLIADYDFSRVLRFDPIASPPPTIKVKGKKKVSTSKAKYALKGTAAGENLARVEVRVGKGAFSTAKGTTNWKFKVPLKDGVNKIQVRAVNADGIFSATARVKIFRE